MLATIRSSGRRTRLLVLLVVVLAGVTALVLYLVNRGPSNAEKECRYLTHQLRATAAERAALSRVPGPTAVFFGDSYTQGLLLHDIRDGYPYVTAAAKHWSPVLNAFGGSGYLNESPCGGEQLAARVPAVIARHPAIVIVQAGLNDVKFSSGQVRSAAEELFRRLRQALPQARIIAVGPHATPLVPHVDATASAISAAAARVHVTFVDTRSWRIPIGPDGVHPTLAGYRTFGLLLAQAIP